MTSLHKSVSQLASHHPRLVHGVKLLRCHHNNNSILFSLFLNGSFLFFVFVFCSISRLSMQSYILTYCRLGNKETRIALGSMRVRGCTLLWILDTKHNNCTSPRQSHKEIALVLVHLAYVHSLHYYCNAPPPPSSSPPSHDRIISYQWG